MTSSAPPPPLGNPGDDRGGPLRAYTIVMTVFSVVALALRFTGRSMMEGRRFWWDDWAALASLPAICFVNGITLSLLDSGLGRHMDTITDMNTFLFKFFISYFSYDIGLFMTKFAALLFLSRVFPSHASSKVFTYALWATHVLNFGWLLGTVFATAFFCSPIEKNWKPLVPGKCGHTPTLMFGSSISSVVIDLVILLLPMPKIWGLQMDLGKKSGLTGVFIVGYLVVVVSVGRLIIVTRSQSVIEADLSWEIAPVFYWFVAEAPVTLLCICLPACLPIINRLFGKHPFGRWTNKSSNRTAENTSSSRDHSTGVRLTHKSTDLRWRDDGGSYDMEVYAKGNSASTITQTTQIGQAHGSRDSDDSDGSIRGILPQAKWNSSYVEGGSTMMAREEGKNVPDWSIRVDREVTVER